MTDLAGPARRASAVLLTAAALATATGCTAAPTTGRSPMPTETITLDQAEQRAREYVHEVARALPGPPPLDPIAGGMLTTECLDPDDDGPPGRFTAAASVLLAGFDPMAFPGVRRAFTEHLGRRGFAVRTDRPDFLVMENPVDEFRVSLQEGGRPDARGLSLTASSPCVWPTGRDPGR